VPLREGKYFFDSDNLEYRKVKTAPGKKMLRFTLWFAGSIVLFLLYRHLVVTYVGSPKEIHLMNQIETARLDLMVLERNMDRTIEHLGDLRLSDDRRYRPVLKMDTLPGYLRQMASGGIERHSDLLGFMNSDLLLSMRRKMDEIELMSRLQAESFEVVNERTTEWKRQMEYLPMISPVNVSFRLGDGLKFREVHPVHGNPQWHHGQDFRCPIGTPVYATGAGTVIEAGWSSGGFGNYVVIDHGYGFRTTYGHLSQVKTTRGTSVRRGELIGLSGTTGISSGPHLHYQIDLFGKVANPLHYFNRDLTEEEYFEMIKTLSAGTNYN
jgi:hypothetical protein